MSARPSAPLAFGNFEMPSGSGEYVQITTAVDAYRALCELATADVEELWILALGPSKLLLRSKMLFRGTVDACMVHPRDVFRFACLENASSIIIAHNHPSSELSPSLQDLVFTRQLVKASRMIEIPVLDHLIVSRHGYVSFAKEGWCEFTGSRLPDRTGAGRTAWSRR